MGRFKHIALTACLLAAPACGGTTHASGSSRAEHPTGPRLYCMDTFDNRVTQAPAGTTPSSLSATCERDGEQPIRRTGATTFYQPQTFTKFTVRKVSGGSYYLDPVRPKSVVHASKPAKRTHKPAAKPKQQPARLYCLYPGAGKIHMVSPLPAGTPSSDWSNACSLNGGRPVQRVSASRFLDARSGATYKVQNAAAGGSYYVVPA
jgi:hypothetical protein